MIKLDKESMKRVLGSELIDVTYRPIDLSKGEDYEEVILDFANGGEISIFIDCEGDVIVEGD